MKILEKDPPLAEECKRPWILVSFLYPLSQAGLMHIAIFTFGPSLMFLLYWILFSKVLLGLILYIIGFVLFIGYGIYYITFCVFDSTKSQAKARQIPQIYFPDKWELLQQYVLIIASVAICFLAAIIYYICFRQMDYKFWILSGCGLFFFPMTLLSAILFDGINELSPLFIGVSIFKVFLGYLGLCLFFFIIVGLIAILFLYGIIPAFVVHGISFYLLMVLANRLGWFYWWYKSKLKWGI
jgi:hypothetical protein